MEETLVKGAGVGDLSEKLRDGTQSRGNSKGKGRAKSLNFILGAMKRN